MSKTLANVGKILALLTGGLGIVVPFVLVWLAVVLDERDARNQPVRPYCVGTNDRSETVFATLVYPESVGLFGSWNGCYLLYRHKALVMRICGGTVRAGTCRP